MVDRNIYKVGVIKKYMKIQINIPDYLNKMLKIKKLTTNKRYIQDVIVDILDDVYKKEVQNGKR
jgi:hypothetical protein